MCQNVQDVPKGRPNCMMRALRVQVKLMRPFSPALRVNGPEFHLHPAQFLSTIMLRILRTVQNTNQIHKDTSVKVSLTSQALLSHLNGILSTIIINFICVYF